jgi:sigma-B regulation protein RsbU (phosphoserine phosphatase)
MLPATIPQLKQFDIAADYIPTLELSGDFYDLIQLNGHIGIAIGDVVGKGVAASLLMASVRSSLRAYAQDLYDISQIIHRVNVLLTRDTLDNEFATLFYGVLDPDTNRLTYCNAGHNPPLLLRNGEVTELDVGGLIVGIDEQATYDMAIVHFQPGDLLLLFSDGMNEAKNFDNVQFGKERIIEAMKSSLTLPDANAMLKHILWQMRCFTGLHHNADDTTAVLIHALPG